MNPATKVSAEDIRIRDIRQVNGRTLEIVWTDGRQDQFDVVHLRRACPCAHCIDEWTGEKRLKPESVPETTRPIKMGSVGAYALQIWFNDGHGTGIYTFSWLRQLARVPLDEHGPKEPVRRFLNKDKGKGANPEGTLSRHE